MKLARVSFWAGLVTVLGGAVLLADWLLPRSLIAPDLEGRFMAPGAGLGFLVVGVAIVALARRLWRARLLVGVCAALLALMAGVRLALGGDGTAPGLSEFFIGTAQPLVIRGPDFASAMVFQFLLMAGALGLLAWRRRFRVGEAFAASLAIAVGVVGFLFVGRFVLGVQPDAALLSAAILRTGLFLAVSAGLFCLAISETQAGEAEAPPAGREPLHPEWKHSLAFGATLGIVVLGGHLSYNLVERFSEDHRRAEEGYRWIAALSALRAALDAAEAAARSYIATGGEPEFQSYGRAIERFDAPLREAVALAWASAGRAPLHGFSQRIHAELARLQLAVAARRAGRPVPPFPSFAAAEEISAALMAMQEDARRNLAARAARRSEALSRAAFGFAAAALAVGVLLLAVHALFERDFAARRRAEAALLRHNDTLKSFAHTVAHDLRAPLRGISGYARELQFQAGALDEHGRHCVRQIGVAAENLEHLIQDTLDYARIDAETPELAPIDLPFLVASLLRQRAPQIREYGAEVATHFGATHLVSWERGLAQVLGNLLDNALKYSRHSLPPRLRIESAETPVAWRLLVYDNGIGFDMKYHDRIFGLFQRLVTPDEFEGTGAGLAIVKKIVDRLGGTVRAEARPGAGATFLVELPKSADGEFP